MPSLTDLYGGLKWDGAEVFIALRPPDLAWLKNLMSSTNKLTFEHDSIRHRFTNVDGNVIRELLL